MTDLEFSAFPLILVYSQIVANRYKKFNFSTSTATHLIAKSPRKSCRSAHFYIQTSLGLAARTTRPTPSAVSAVPTMVEVVISSSNNAQAISAVVGGTR